MKKVLALALALVMVFTLSVSALAAPASTATLSVTYFGVELLNETVTLTSGMTAKDALDLYAGDLELTWKTVTNLNPRFTEGSAAYVIDAIYGYGTEPVGADSGITAQFWSSQYPGYGIESMTVSGNKTIYHYIYVGNDWNFTVNDDGQPTDPVYKDANDVYYTYYLDQYTVQAGDTIHIDFEQQTVRWDSEDYWLTA